MVGSVGSVSENSNNAGGYFGGSPQNPQGGQPPYGSTDGMDGLGAATVGGVNAPPSSTRSGTSAGPSAAGSCMDSYQVNNSGLGTPPPTPGTLGSPTEGPTGPSLGDAAADVGKQIGGGSDDDCDCTCSDGWTEVADAGHA
jgi:hypothetical protein